MSEQLRMYLSYPFVQYALVVGTLIALCAALLGIPLVLRRFSFLSTGLSNTAFCITAIATAAQLGESIFLTLAVTTIASIWLLSPTRKSRMSGDSMIALVASGTMAIGYLIMNLFSKSSNLSGDVCSVLFGATSILTLSKSEVATCICLSVITIYIFKRYYNRIFALTFDETFVAATSDQGRNMHLLVAISTAIIITMALNLVGSLLISALIVFPALTAMRLFKSFKSVTICSAFISVTSALTGILLSIVFSTPVGSTIVSMNVGFYIIFWIIEKLKRY